jgi:hypothetical protein
VLLGDAAWGGTLGGQGTPLAIVGAYVLAGELMNACDDLASALTRYEAVMRPYATACQKGAERVGSFFAPRTRFGLVCRDLFYRAITSPMLIAQFEKMVKASATALRLPVYDSLFKSGCDGLFGSDNHPDGALQRHSRSLAATRGLAARPRRSGDSRGLLSDHRDRRVRKS